MPDYNAGQAYLTLLPDLSSFGAKVREELAKERFSASAEIKPELDTAALDAEIADVEAKLRAISDAKSKLEIDDTEAKFKIDELVARLNELQAKRASIVARAETGEAKAELDRLDAKAHELDGKTVNIHARTDTGNSESEINALMAAGVSLGPAIIPVAAAVTAALAAIGTGAVLGAAGIGAILLGFHGVGDAVKDLGTVEESQGKTAAQSAAQQISSANAIASAQDGVRNAVRGVEDAQRSAAIANQQAAEQVSNAQRSVSDAYISASTSIQNALQSESQAEQTLANAQQQEQLAQESLTLARQAAQRQIESLTLAVADGALAERQAQLNIQKAKQALDQVLANPTASQLQREQAQLTYDQSVQQLTDIQVRNKQNAEDKATADAKGVEGSQQVQAAQRGVISAAQATANAQQGLADAQRNVDEARRKGAEQIAVAQQSLSDAQARQAETARAGAESVTKAQEGVISAQRALQGALAAQAAQQDQTSASAKKLASDMDKLSPAGQAFAHFVHDDLQPKVKELQAVAQQGLLPGVEQGLKNAMPIFPQVKGLVGDLSSEFGSLAARAGSALNDPFWTNWILFIRREAVPSTESFGKTLGNLATGGAAVLQAFAPIWDQMGAGIEGWSRRFSEAAQNLQNNPQFQDFLEYVKVNGPLVAHFLGDLITTLVHVGESLGPLGHVTLEVVDGFLQLINSMPTPELTILVTALALAYNGYNALKIVKTIAGFFGDFKTSVLDNAASMEAWTAKVTGSASAGEKAASAVKGLGAALPLIGAAFIAADLAQSAFAIDQDKVVEGLIKGGQAARDAAASYDHQSLFAKILTGSIVGIGSSLDKANAQFQAQRAALDPLARAQQDATRAQNDYLLAVEKWGTQSAQAVEAQHRYATATAEGARQQEILKSGLDRTTTSLKQQQTQLLEGSDAEIRWRDALQSATDGVKNNGGTLDLNTEQGRRNQQNVNDLIRAMIAEEDTMKNNGATTAELTTKHDEFRNQLINVYTQMGITRDQAQLLTDKYLGIRNIGTISTDFVANVFPAVAAVNKMATDIANALRSIPDESIAVAFTAPGTPAGEARAIAASIPRATGGPIFGAGTGTSDSIPAMLSHGEHVWTASEVQAAGGHGAVYKMRQAAAKGYAAGGPVLWSDTLNGITAGIPTIPMHNADVVQQVVALIRAAAAAAFSAAFTGSPDLAGWIQTALRLTGTPGSWAGPLSVLIGRESGGNPNAINLTDSNAAAGHPSQGLMQCVSMQTMILTKRGWLPYADVRVGDETIGYNSDTGRSEWTRITKVVLYENGEVWRIGHKGWHADVTPNHRWWSDSLHKGLVSQDTHCLACERTFTTPRGFQVHMSRMHGVSRLKLAKRHVGEFVRTEDFKDSHRIRLAAPADTDGIPGLSTEDAAIIAWLQGDGHLQPTKAMPVVCPECEWVPGSRKNRPIDERHWATSVAGHRYAAHGIPSNRQVDAVLDGGYDGTIYQSKPAMVTKLRALLSHVPHSEHTRQRAENHYPATSFRLSRDYTTELVKRSGVMDAGPEAFVLAMSPDQRAAWLSAMIDAEGHRMPGRKPGWNEYVRIVQIDGPLQDAIKLAVYLEGWRPTYSANSAERRGFKPCGAIGMAKPHVVPSTFHKPERLPNQPVWCVKTDLETWTAKLDGHVFLTGNTIPSTFTAYHQAGTSWNITDPVANIAAGINYIKARYGDISNVQQANPNLPPKGYDSGGWLPPGMTMAYNGTGVPERVLTAPQYQALSTAAPQGGPKIDVHVYPRAEHSEAAIADMVEHRLGFALRAVT